MLSEAEEKAVELKVGDILMTGDIVKLEEGSTTGDNKSKDVL
jgi:hypothetical protein